MINRDGSFADRNGMNRGQNMKTLQELYEDILDQKVKAAEPLPDGGFFGRSYFRYWSIQFKISVIRSILFSGFPPRESSWFSPWKRQSLEGQPFLITALYMASPSAI